MSQKTIAITSGPSREELFDGLRLFAEKRQVGFTIEDNGRKIILPFTMRKIEAEDGSGHSWNLEMVLGLESLGPDTSMMPIYFRKAFFGNPIKSSITISAYYSDRTRNGSITINPLQ